MPSPIPPGRRASLAAFALWAVAAACSTPPDAPQPSSPNTLVRLDAEAPGTHCASGGTAIRMGPDSNGNGSLEEDEVSSSQYVCDALTEESIHFGNLQVQSSADLAKLEGVEYLVGDLFIRGDLVPEVHLPRLQRITGALTVGWEGLVPLEDGGSLPPMSTLRLPALRSVGNLLLTLPYVQTLDLSALESVGDMVELTSVGTLTAVDLPALRSVGGDFSFHYTAHFAASSQSLRAPLLASVSGGFLLDYNAQLATAELPALAQVAWLSVQGNASLSALVLPALERTGAVTVSQNEVLSTLSLPKLGGGSGATLVTANPALSQCSALALEVQRRRAGYLEAVLREANQPDTSCARNSASTCVPLSLADGSTSYTVCYAEQDFAQASADCASVLPGGHLAVFETQAEFLRLQEAVKGRLAVPTSVWLGYSDQDTEGSFQWLLGGSTYEPQAGDSAFWSPGEPDDAGGEDCVVLLGLTGAAGNFVPGYASDTACSLPRPALCEAP
jgi:lectin-like protein